MWVNSVFTMEGVTMEGPEEVFYLSLLVSLIYSPKDTGAAFSGKLPFKLPNWSRYDCVNLYIPSRFYAWPRSKSSTNNVIPLYFSFFNIGGCIGGDCSYILLHLSTSSTHAFLTSSLV